MPSTISGDPTNFPDEITIPSDGDGPIKAADVNPAFEGLMDRTSYLQDLRLRLAGLQPLNIVATNASVGQLQRSVFDPRLGCWYIFGQDAAGDSNVRKSTDLGVTWSSSLVLAVDAGEDCYHGAVDPATSNAVFATDTRYVFVLDAGGTASRVDVYGGGIVIIGDGVPNIVWDPINSRFVWLLSNSETPAVFNSPTGATWTSRTLPGAWAELEVASMAVNTTTGRIVAVAKSAATTWKVMTSDDGGTTWTLRSDITSVSPSAGTRASLIYEPQTDSFVWTVGEVSGTYSSSIYVSTDQGLTWTLRKSLTSVCLIGLAADGSSVWCAIALSSTFNPRLVYSIDEGVTWLTTGLTLSSTAADVGGVTLGGGRFSVVVGGSVRLTMAAGQPEIGTVT